MMAGSDRLNQRESSAARCERRGLAIWDKEENVTN